MLEQKIEDDLKTAMLAGEQTKVTTLRTLKAVLLNQKVAENKRDTGLSDDEVITLFSKEAKKRQESADLYVQGGSPERAAAELAEKALIETYLPAALSETEVAAIVDEVIDATGANSPQDLGIVIGQTRARIGAAADGGLIARLVKERLGA